MAELDLTNIAAASIATPASGVTAVFVDSADRKVKTKDSNGVISTLVNDGLQDRNVLTNGGFAVQQRVATASTAIPAISTTTRAGQVADRWAVTTSVASNLNWAQIDSSGTFETGLLARYYGSIIASTAGKKVMLSQWVINAEMAHLRGQKVRISVKHNQKVGAGQTYLLGLLQLNASGTVDVSPAFLTGAWSTTTGVDPAWGTNLQVIAPDAAPTGENGTVGASWLSITSVATTWTRSSAVFSVPTGAKNLVVVLFSDATGGTTDNLSVAEFQMTQGPDIVDYKEPPLAETLVRCQRFFQKSFPLTTVPAASAVTNGATMGIIGKAGAVALAAKMFPVFSPPMWKTPTTLTLFTPTAAGAVPFRIDGTTPAAQTSVAQSLLSDHGAFVSATGDANGAVGDMVAVHWTAEAEFIL